MTILAIDPGTTESAFLVWSKRGVVTHGKIENPQLLKWMMESQWLKHSDSILSLVAIEMVASYGMPVGKEIFETVLWIGRFLERAPTRVELVYRKDVKIHLCGSMKAKDANIRQALIDKHGPPGTKKNPGKTYGISGDIWAALAVADYAAEKFQMTTAPTIG